MSTLSKMEVKLLLKLEREKAVTELANEFGLSIYQTSILVTSPERTYV